MIAGARHGEQQIGQPIDITDEERVDRGRERHEPSLDPATDRSRHMECGAGRGATRQDEMRQRRYLAIEPIDEALEPQDVGICQERLGETFRQFLRRIGELRAKREQIALDMR